MNITKKLRIVTFGLLAAGVGVALMADPAIARDDDLISIDVLQDDVTSTALYFEFGEFTRKDIRIDGQPYASLSLGKESLKMEAGLPSLPDVSRSIIIPNLASVDIVVLGGDFYEIEDIDVAPSKGSLLRTTDPATVPHTFGKAYKQDAFWPADLATLSDPYILRAKRGVTVTVNPFQYNPVTRTLRVYRNMTVAVDNVGMGRTNLLPTNTKHEGGSAFHKIYASQFVNYNGQNRSYPISEEGSMLIITADQYESNIQPLADHKNSIGLSTTVKLKSEVGSTWAQINDYIAAMYGGSDLVYVLLVGDASDITAPTAAGGLSDPTYALQAGSDNYPDIIIGRFSANNATHVDLQVQKTIAYEAEQFTTKDEFGGALGIASNQGPGDDGETDDQHMDLIGTKLMDFVHTAWSSEYDPSGSVADAVNVINNGVGVIQYTGHGYQTGWGNGAALSNSDVNGLTNTQMWPFIVSVACVVGEFNTGDCFCEAWQWASHNGQPTGSIAHYGSTINQSWNEPMCGQDSMVDRYVDEEFFSFGALCYMGSCTMMDEYGAVGVDMYKTWTLFGDPSVIISGTAQPPTGMRVNGSNLVAEGPNGGPFSPISTTYTLTNNEDYEIDYSVLELADWLDLEGVTEGTIPALSDVSLTLSINTEANAFSNGVYEAQVIFSNLTNADGNVVKPAVLTVGTPQPVYTWDMSSDPGWTTSGQWAWGVPTGGGGEYGNPDPTSGSVGSQVMGYNLNGDYPGSLPETNLTTNAIDCSALTDTSLVFDRYLNVETDYYDHAYLRISTNGSQWTTIWENSGEVADSSWSTHEYDISAIADGEETVYVRWVMGETDSIWNFSGWNIDEVVIKAVDSSAPCLGDFNGSGEVNVDDLLTVIGGWGNGYGVDDLLEVLGNWGSDC